MDRNRNLNPASNVNCNMNKQMLPVDHSASTKPDIARLAVFAMLLSPICFTSPSIAQIPDQLNGVSVNSLVNTVPVNTMPVDGTRSEFSSQGQIDELEINIENIEAEEGAWGAGLSEQLAGLGKAYQLRGEHDEAIDAFERAIHVNRINNGLYDLSQVNLIEDLLDSLMVTGQWEEVHERQQYLYWIHRRNYGENDPRMLPVIDRLGSWYINDYAMNPENRMVGHLVDAYNLFSQATSIIENQYGDSDLRMIVPLRGLVLSNWFLWTFASQNPGIANSNMSLNNDVTYSSLDANKARLAPYLNNNFANGKAALDRMVEIYSENPNSPPGAAATAKIELGDWHMLLKRWRSATELYQEAYSSLAANEETRSQAEKIFERPVALPDLVLMESDVEQVNVRGSQELATSEAPNYVLVSYDVSRFGDARNIDIIESFPEDNVGMRARVKRSLSNTRFRPRIVDGEPVESTGLIQKYVFNQ